MSKESDEQALRELLDRTDSICPDYDGDCSTVSDPIACYMGYELIIGDEDVGLEKAKGICPIIHTFN